MKRFLIALCCVSLLLTLTLIFVGCDGGDGNETNTDTTASDTETNIDGSESSGEDMTDSKTESDTVTTESNTESETESKTESESESETLQCSHSETVIPGVEPTCAKEGLSEGLYCSICNEILIEQTVIATTPHATVTVDAKPASCYEDGHEAYEYCTSCDYTTFLPILAAHSIKSVEAKDANCFEDGHNAYEYCLNCDYSTKIVYPSYHELVRGDGKSASCFEDGWNDYEYCLKCEYTTKQIFPAGHVIIEVEEKAATCYENGNNAYEYCVMCEYTTLVVVPGGHSLVFVDAKPTSCAEEGYEAYEYCEKCDYTSKQTIPMLDHTLFDVPEVAPTCLATGISAHEECENCSYSTAVILPISTHKFSDEWFDDVIATPETEGVRSHHCVYGCGGRSEITKYEYESYTAGLKFTLLSSGTYEVSLGDAGGLDIVIPKKYLGIPVTHIGEFDDVNSVSIPEGITHITAGAFYQARIESGEIKFPSTLKSIEGFAFNYSNLHTVDFGSSMPNVSYEAFGSTLHAVKVDNLATWFNICSGGFTILQAHGHLYVGGKLVEGEVTLPEEMDVIPYFAFANQIHVTSLVIPRTTRVFCYSALNNSGITSVYYKGTLEEWEKMTKYGGGGSAWENVTLYIDGKLHEYYPSDFSDPGEDNDEAEIERTIGEFIYEGVHSYDIVDGIYIYRAYLGDTSSGKVVLPESINGHRYNLGKSAFENCDWLTSITVRGVDMIGRNAISGCDNLTELILEEGIVFIDSGAFAYNASLETVSLPKSLCFMTIGVFYGSTNLKEIIFLNTKDWYVGSGLYKSYWQMCPECIVKTLTRGEWGRYPDARNMFTDPSVIPDGDNWC